MLFVEFAQLAVVIGALTLKPVGRRWSGNGWVVWPEDGQPNSLRFTQVWVKRNGNWKLLIIHNAYAKPESFPSPVLPAPNRDAQNPASQSPPNAEAQKCAALTELNLENAPGGPALITSARLVDVPAIGLEQWFVIPSGYGTTNSQIATGIYQL